jgi:hypothetical protein
LPVFFTPFGGFVVAVLLLVFGLFPVFVLLPVFFTPFGGFVVAVLLPVFVLVPVFFVPFEGFVVVVLLPPVFVGGGVFGGGAFDVDDPLFGGGFGGGFCFLLLLVD